MVVSRWMEGPYQGEIKELSHPLGGERRVTVVRASGRQTDWTVCGECKVGAEQMVVLNKKEINAMVKERDLATDTTEQAELREKMLRLFEWDIPLGVLGEMPWTEVR